LGIDISKEMNVPYCATLLSNKRDILKGFILDLIDSIASKTEQELQDMYSCMQDILDHNHRLLIEKKFTKDIVYVE
jgi:hypothetical protein